jgi:flagellin
MATLSAHGSFYRIQDNMSRNQLELSNNMQRLSSGLRNVTAGSRAGDVAIVGTLDAGVATLQYGKANAESGVAALEMAVADLSRLSDIITRLYEMNQIGANSFTTADDQAMLVIELGDLTAEYNTVGNEIKYKGTDMAVATLSMQTGSIVFGSATTNLGFGTVANNFTATSTKVKNGSAATELTADKLAVDTLRLEAAKAYNLAQFHALHAQNALSAAKIELSGFRDVDFAAETSELAKNQIIAQAGTAMLAQANDMGKGVLALLQS